ncbi:beta-galactosidase [Fontisphaera persica]|uniref:beta-galactosidase n=1 Tax=Fontisphaera persica TaxID=2974023 RepID=UPI0024C00DC5|nr:beta-galactosidase [Fontisphaera persica]WCJ58624.1 beta-galactosidase [Fontisphaera persica]
MHAPKIKWLARWWYGWMMCTVAGWVTAADSQVIDLRPFWDERKPLANPHKGWYHHYPDNHINKYQVTNDQDLLTFPGMDHLYIRLAWAYLEPEEGRFQWEVIDRLIEKWTRHGLGIAFRISCKETSTDRPEQQYATPRWVKEAGARGGYYWDGKEVGPDGPWEPDFGDPIFLAKLENFLRAFAARYDQQPWLRYVDVGSIGDWGEGHSWAGSHKECGLDVRLKHLELHRRYFKRALLVVSDDLVYAIKDPAER